MVAGVIYSASWYVSICEIDGLDGQFRDRRCQLGMWAKSSEGDFDDERSQRWSIWL